MKTLVLPPTLLEARLYAALDALGLRYRPQHAFAGDCVVPAWLHRHAIALDIRYYTHYRDPKRRVRDQRLLAQFGVLTVYVTAADLDSDAQAVESMRRALAPLVPELKEGGML